MTNDEKEFWDLILHGPPKYELFNVNTFKEADRVIEVFGYRNVDRRRDFKVEVLVDGMQLEQEKDFFYHPDAVSIKNAYPVGYRIHITNPLHFSCVIVTND